MSVDNYENSVSLLFIVMISDGFSMSQDVKSNFPSCWIMSSFLFLSNSQPEDIPSARCERMNFVTLKSRQQSHKWTMMKMFHFLVFAELSCPSRSTTLDDFNFQLVKLMDGKFFTPWKNRHCDDCVHLTWNSPPRRRRRHQILRKTLEMNFYCIFRLISP